MRLREWVSTVGAAVAGVVAVVAVGGAPWWAQAVAATAILVALAANARSRRVLARPSPLLVLLGVATGLTLLQLIPLPSSLNHALDPVGQSLREDGAEVLGISPLTTISLDPGSTTRALCVLVIMFSFAMVVVRLSVTERGRYRVLAGVAALCGLTVVIVGTHALFGLDQLYGVYAPAQGKPIVLGPLINGNHLACLCALGAVVSAGLATYPQQPSVTRGAWLITAGACAIVTLSTLSRGGTLALIAGGVVLGVVIIAQRLAARDGYRGRSSFATRSLPLVVVITCAVVVALYASAGGVAEQLKSTSFDELTAPRSKYTAWKSSLTLLQQAPWFGVGRGAFESVFPRIHPASGFSTFSHVENEYLQAAIDWGLLGAVMLAICFGWLLTVAIRRWSDGPLAAAALGALVVVAVQSAVDFGVELLGVALPAIAVAATLAYSPLRETAKLPRAFSLRLAHVVVLAGAIILLCTSASNTVSEDRTELAASASHDEVLAVAERHPLDYYAYARIAQSNATGSVRALNHALRLHPSHSGIRLLAGRLLLAAGRSEQAAVEYGHALFAATDRRRVLEEIATKFSPEIAARAIPIDDPRSVDTLSLLEDLKQQKVAVAWLQRTLARRPRDEQACEQLASFALRNRDLALANDTQMRCPSTFARNELTSELARLRFESGDHAGALSLLVDVEQWQSSAVRSSAWLLACDASIALQKRADGRRCLHRLESLGDISGEVRSEIVRKLLATDPASGTAAPSP